MIIDGKMFVGIPINNELEYTERLLARVNHKNELYINIYSTNCCKTYENLKSTIFKFPNVYK